MFRGMGWIPDLPDARDYSVDCPQVSELLANLRVYRDQLPDELDLSISFEDQPYLSAAANQNSLNSSPIHAVLTALEYFERRVVGSSFSGSARFLYKVVRNRLKLPANYGVDLRSTLKTLSKVGIPSEEYWPNDDQEFDAEPSPFVYSLANRSEDLVYFRLGGQNDSSESLWNLIVRFLAAGFPVIFGFSVPSSITGDPNIPFRPGFDRVVGGQAVVAIGYRKDHFGRGQHALKIRSSWGADWGENGNGWLPKSFVTNSQAGDFWTILSRKWIGSEELCCPDF